MIVNNYKHQDNINRFNIPENYIDGEWLEYLFDIHKGSCHYCGVFLSLKTPRTTAISATVERIDNNKLHTRDNCVFACYYCNCRVRGSQKSYEDMLKHGALVNEIRFNQ